MCNSIHIILGLKYCSLSLPKAVLYLLVIKINASDLRKEGLIYFFFALIVQVFLLKMLVSDIIQLSLFLFVLFCFYS